MAWTGYTRRADVERLLRRHGVQLLYGKNGQVCTALEALNAAVLGKESANQGYEFE